LTLQQTTQGQLQTPLIGWSYLKTAQSAGAGIFHKPGRVTLTMSHHYNLSPVVKVLPTMAYKNLHSPLWYKFLHGRIQSGQKTLNYFESFKLVHMTEKSWYEKYHFYSRRTDKTPFYVITYCNTFNKTKKGL